MNLTVVFRKLVLFVQTFILLVVFLAASFFMLYCAKTFLGIDLLRNVHIEDFIEDVNHQP